ncbi:hypothetical protein BDW71DRAFT_187053 [Aspergillus fruticulosus]
MSIFAEASYEDLYADDLDRHVYSRLLNSGRRKAVLIGKSDRPYLRPQRSRNVCAVARRTLEGKIQCLRTVAQTTALDPADIVVRYRPEPSASFEYATALPRPKDLLMGWRIRSYTLGENGLWALHPEATH